MLESRGVPSKWNKLVPHDREQLHADELPVDFPKIAETQLGIPSLVDVLTPAQPVYAPERGAERSVEQVVDKQGDIAEQQVDDPMPQAVEHSALQLRSLWGQSTGVVRARGS